MRVFTMALLWTFPALWGGSAEMDEALRLYNFTDYEQSLKVLLNLPQKDAEVLELIGRNYLKQGEYKKSTEFLEKASVKEPGNAAYVLWLGRAFGRRAESASPFTAPGLASKARQCFEKAVQLDPTYVEAMSDLFEYYMQAPGFIGGGLDKAAAMGARIAQVDPAEGHYVQAKLAERRKEFASAEEQFRRAAELAPQQVGRLIDLAKFLAKEGRYQESDQSFEHAAKIAPDSPKLLYARADTYIRNGRKLDTARELLKRYLASELTPEDPPRSQAEKLLQ